MHVVVGSRPDRKVVNTFDFVGRHSNLSLERVFGSRFPLSVDPSQGKAKVVIGGIVVGAGESVVFVHPP